LLAALRKVLGFDQAEQVISGERRMASEIIFEVREDEADGGYTAAALGYGIHTQGETLDELRAMVKDAVQCYFDESMEAPKITVQQLSAE
jgi:predicted RNase H-like HicB family nuclease